MAELDELAIDNIPAENTNNDVNFEPFGKEITVDEVSKRLSHNLYIQLSEDSDQFVLDAVERAQIYIGTVLSYLGVKINLEDKLHREIVLMQTIYELHMALGHEEAGREYRLQAKNTIISAFGSFPDSDNQEIAKTSAAVVIKPATNPRSKKLNQARGFTL